MSNSTFVPFERAQRHPITCDKPAVDFFSGALLGNGGLGAVVTTRPDAVVIHFGHNNVWDIRVAEDHQEAMGTFAEIFARVCQIPAEYATLEEDPWYRAYCEQMQENYRQLYPRPFPCGSLILGFDRRQVELLGHQLQVATGLCEVYFLVDNAQLTLQLFTDLHAERLWLRMIDATGQPTGAPFDRVRLLPDPDAGKTILQESSDTPTTGSVTGVVFPNDSDVPPNTTRFAAFADETQATLAFRQVLPCLAQGTQAHPQDRAFCLTVRVNSDISRASRLNWHNQMETMGPLERRIGDHDAFVACVQLDEGLASTVPPSGNVIMPTTDAYLMAWQATAIAWESYWNCSGVALADEFLERIWYWNLYFLRCALRPGVTCPGLFANWSYRDIGIAWHGDYHMNYNTQQPFWATFASNHVELHLPYVDLVDQLLPISRKWAQEYYGLRGAYFPHSAYPVAMNIMPYPVPTWGWEICETPWTVQSLWWHYRYTQDLSFLRSRAFRPIKEAVLFLVDYMQRPEAHGLHWGDDRYHIFPTVPPELYGLLPGFRLNNDCLVDLTLTKFVFNAFLDACPLLGRATEEAELMEAVQHILAHFPNYPKAPSPLGEVFVSVPGEDAQIVYNVPNSAMTVFPGEEHGLHSPPDEYAIAANSYRNQRIEGGNELVFLNLQAARLGLLDLARFKRQINYCLLPNGTCTDMVLQVHGRYTDVTRFDFMAPMGIWFENFALPAVVNECLLQSYNGALRLFPNWPLSCAAEFRTLRAVGAFLVSAACAHGAVQWVEITSKVGGLLTVVNPWPAGVSVTRGDTKDVLTGESIQLTTSPGESIHLHRA